MVNFVYGAVRQHLAMNLKHMLEAWRSKKSTIVQLLLPAIVFGIFAIVARPHQLGETSSSQNVWTLLYIMPNWFLHSGLLMQDRSQSSRPRVGPDTPASLWLFLLSHPIFTCHERHLRQDEVCQVYNQSFHTKSFTSVFATKLHLSGPLRRSRMQILSKLELYQVVSLFCFLFCGKAAKIHLGYIFDAALPHLSDFLRQSRKNKNTLWYNSIVS